MTDISVVYVTTKDRREAKNIAQAILAEKLAACCNILAHTESLYLWEGAIADEDETVMLVKTRTDLVPALMDRIKKLHSFDVPCMMVLKTESVYKPYADWLDNLLRGEPIAVPTT